MASTPAHPFQEEPSPQASPYSFSPYNPMQEPLSQSNTVYSIPPGPLIPQSYQNSVENFIQQMPENIDQGNSRYMSCINVVLLASHPAYPQMSSHSRSGANLGGMVLSLASHRLMMMYIDSGNKHSLTCSNHSDAPEIRVRTRHAAFIAFASFSNSNYGI